MVEVTPTADGQILRHVFNSSPIGIVTKTLEGQLLSANPAFCALLGFSEEELCSKQCVDLSPPEDAEKDSALFQNLRAGLIDQYQLEKRYFRRDGSLVWANLNISLLKVEPAPLVLAMVQDITAKKTAEEALLEVNRTLQAQASLLQSREELLTIFVEDVPAGVAMLNRDMQYLQVSDRFCADYSLTRSQVMGRPHYEIFPDLPDRWKEVHRRALAGETMRADEDRWDREGRTVWLRWEVRPWRDAEGVIGGILIFAEDITRRKQMEEALSSLSRKLIDSQEQERARIGRELHDDINQRLSMLVIQLEKLRNTPVEIGTHHLQELQEEALAISADVQALSHELHASKLEYLGVVSGMRSWCREFGERQKMKIDFSSEVSGPLPFEIGLCLFRVLQEALHNIVKHSGVNRARVELVEQANEVHLTVRDSGRGFDLEEAKRGSGLGLTSMSERLQLVKGQLHIRSQAQEGTTIHARAPIAKAKPAKAGS